MFLEPNEEGIYPEEDFFTFWDFSHRKIFLHFTFQKILTSHED